MKPDAKTKTRWAHINNEADANAPVRVLTLLLVRHGETAWNAQGRVQGGSDIPLSDVGRTQAHCLANRLTAEWQPENQARRIPGPPCAVVSSDLSRARETAEIIRAAVFPLTLPALQTTPLLRERSFGEWEGLTLAEGQAKFGAHLRHHNARDGESVAAVWERMQSALRLLWDSYAVPAVRGDNGAVLVAGHGASLRHLLCRAVGAGPEASRHFLLDNTGLSIATFTGPHLENATGQLLLCNDTSHLAGERG